MNKNDIQAKLEELYQAQEVYQQLRLEFERKIRRESTEYIPLYDVLGDNDYGMESVDLAMKEFEYQMQIAGEKWDDECKSDTFYTPKDNADYSTYER